MEIKNGDHYLSQVKDAGCGVYVQKAKMISDSTDLAVRSPALL